MRYYLPIHPVTENYRKGMLAIENDDLATAVSLLGAEPSGSTCYGLAFANKAMAELELGRYRACETSARLALARFKSTGCPQPPIWIQAIRNLGETLSREGRLSESLSIFEEGSQVADRLTEEFSDVARECIIEKAYIFNAWGGSLLGLDLADSAIQRFLMARDLYRGQSNDIVGERVTLTNLANAYTTAGDNTKAALAIEEATQLAQGNDDQLYEINIAAARLGILPKDRARTLLMNAAWAAETGGFIEKAYTRYCINAHLADREEDWRWGLEAVRRAKEIEDRLTTDSLNPPKLRFYEAAFLEQSGRSLEDVLVVLLEGARLWVERLPGRLAVQDYQQAVGLMHDHLRKLSALLLSKGRISEALLAFELGRARRFAIEINRGFDHPLLTTNPFGALNIDSSLLQRAQRGLNPGDLVVSLAVLPPHLVAFIVSSEEVRACETPLVKDIVEAGVFGKSILEIPAEIVSGKAPNCIAKQLRVFSEEIVRQVGDRKIVSLSPHALLHSVPWRALLRNAGLRWSQLSFITQFSPLFDPDHPNPDLLLQTGATALGYGTAGLATNELNLEDEAEDFSSTFGSLGKFVPGASSNDLRAVLCRNEIVLVSCHGTNTLTELGPRFFLSLRDGNYTLEDILNEGQVRCPLLVLSVCSSGTYEVAWGDYPVGAAPTILLAGAKFCICTRFPLDAHFAKVFFPLLGELLSRGESLGMAFGDALREMEQRGYDLWTHLACVELLGRGT